jgi:hypothetical protein
MSREIMEWMGEPDDKALNITVRKAIRTRGEEAERVTLKELSQVITRRVWMSTADDRVVLLLQDDV